MVQKVLRLLLWLGLLLSVGAMFWYWSALEASMLAVWFLGNGALGSYLLGLFEKRSPMETLKELGKKDDDEEYHHHAAEFSEPPSDTDKA